MEPTRRQEQSVNFFLLFVSLFLANEKLLRIVRYLFSRIFYTFFSSGLNGINIYALVRLRIMRHYCDVLLLSQCKSEIFSDVVEKDVFQKHMDQKVSWAGLSQSYAWNSASSELFVIGKSSLLAELGYTTEFSTKAQD